MKPFKQLVLESNKEEFEIFIWCPWFNKLDVKHKKTVTDIFKMFGRPHPNGFINAFHIRGNADVFKQVKYVYKEDSVIGPTIQLTNIHSSKGQAQFLMEEITHRSFSDAFRLNRIEDSLKELVQETYPGTKIIRTVLPEGKLIDLYGDVKERLPELQGMF